MPDWIQVDFAGSKTIDEISVFSLHDNYTVENTPTETQTFTLYGLIAFDVQYWNGSTWTTIPNGNVTGNNKVWRKFTFSPITTSKIRVTINAVPDSWSRVVEIQAFGTSAGGEKVQWLVTDHLGTPRIVLDQTGSLANVKRHDYLPFGEELFAGTGGRTVAQGYAGDGVRQQFTSKERDVETALDYFIARYYSSTQGRFTSVDPENAGAVEDEPQSWNAYAYVQNNPLAFVDPEGLERCALLNEDGSCGQWVGDYDGEISTEITGGIFADGAYWNDEQQIWETKEQYKSRTWDPQQEFANEVARRTGWMEPYGEIGVDLMPVPGPKLGIIKRVGKAVGLIRVGRHAFTHAWIKRKLFAKLPKLVGEADAKKFKEALEKGVVGPTGESGIKVLNSPVGQYTHELKIGGSAQRLLGRVDENGVLVFDKLVRGGLH